MGKGYKRKTRWRTLDIGVPPGEEDEEDEIRNDWKKRQENGVSSKKSQPGHKTGRTDSTGSTTSDYASAVSRSKRDGSGGLPSQPKIIFNENEYTRITTPRQDVLFKKGYLSRKKVGFSTASTSATPSTTESQSASHSTADGSETTEDQKLLDCKENGAEEYPVMVGPSAQFAYGTFYDHASGYYYEYPMMVMDPASGMPQPAMHNVLTAVPCGPVPLRPIEWVNPAFVPKLGDEQYCVMDYQPSAHLAQYPTLVDANGVPLPVPTEYTDESQDPCFENGLDSATSWADVADENEQNLPTTETQNGTTENSSEPTVEGEAANETPADSENYLENALAQVHVTHVAVPTVPQPYMYPGHYMFGPSLVNVNGVTIQCAPMVRNTGGIVGPKNAGTGSKRRRKKKLSERKSRCPNGPNNGEAEEQGEEDTSEAENAVELSQIAGVSEMGTARFVAEDCEVGGSISTTSSHRPLNPECQEFRPVLKPRTVAPNFVETANHQSNSEASSSTNTAENHQQRDVTSESDEKSISQTPVSPNQVNNQDSTISRISEAAVIKSNVETTEKLNSKSGQEVEAAPVEFAAEVFANVTNLAERALASRTTVEGTPMKIEIGLDATSVDFKVIMDKFDGPHQPEETIRSRRRIGSVEKEIVTNGQATVNEEHSLVTSIDGVTEILPEVVEIVSSKRQRGSGINDQRGSRSASPGMINRTTTPINATQRLPESYESLVIRGSNSSCLSTVSAVTVPQTARNRKYSAKAPKFVREATPGPDLDAVHQQTHHQSIELEDPTRIRNISVENGNNVAPTVITAEITTHRNFNNDNGTISMGIDAIEAEVHRYSLSTSDSCYTDSNGANKRDGNTDVSNEDSGVESQTRFSSEHPIIDAVTEWLERANSPEIFVASTMISESEPEDDELEEEEPPKNLQGNPMPALSANSSVNDIESLRLASCGKFASVIDGPVNSTETTRNTRNINNISNIEIERNVGNCVPRILRSKKKRLALAKHKASKISAFQTKNDYLHGENKTELKPSDASPSNDVHEETARRTIACRNLVDNNRVMRDDVCEFTEKDSVAGMRVAKSSRTKIMMKMMDSYKSRVEKSKRSKAQDKSTVIMLSSRDVPVENVKVKVRRLTDGNDEGIVEDEEVSVRTFEKGQIVVSIDGKVLPVAEYEPILLQHQQNDERTKICEEPCKKPQYAKLTSEKNECNDETSTISDNSVNKRNSLGSIEEPDVLECWEVESIEPITTPKKQLRDTSQEGEIVDDDLAATEVDPAAVEIVRKYYRLEAMRDSGASVTSVEDEHRDDDDDDAKMRRNSIPNSPERMIESLCSEEIPVIGERMSKIVEKMLDDAGIPVDEAVEVYESCYNGKPPSYLLGFDSKIRRNGTFYGRNYGRDGNLPCKAACCNVQ